MRLIRTEEELKEIAEVNIVYEVDMLRQCASVLSKPLNQLLENMALESFLVHVRNLREFLYGEGENSDDVVAGDFFPGPGQWEDKNIRPPIPKVIEDNLKRLNKALAHVSYSRLKYKGPAKKWPSQQIASELIAVVRVFLRKLPQNRSAWFSRLGDF